MPNLADDLHAGLVEGAAALAVWIPSLSRRVLSLDLGSVGRFGLATLKTGAAHYAFRSDQEIVIVCSPGFVTGTAWVSIAEAQATTATETSRRPMHC